MDKKATGIVSYLTLIGWLIAYCVGDKEGARFHLNQSLVLLLAGIIASATEHLPLFGNYLSWVLGTVVAIFWIMGFVFACQGRDEEVPIIGSIQLLK